MSVPATEEFKEYNQLYKILWNEDPVFALRPIDVYQPKEMFIMQNKINDILSKTVGDLHNPYQTICKYMIYDFSTIERMLAKFISGFYPLEIVNFTDSQTVGYLGACAKDKFARIDVLYCLHPWVLVDPHLMEAYIRTVLTTQIVNFIKCRLYVKSMDFNVPIPVTEYWTYDEVHKQSFIPTVKVNEQAYPLVPNNLFYVHALHIGNVNYDTDEYAIHTLTPRDLYEIPETLVKVFYSNESVDLIVSQIKDPEEKARFMAKANDQAMRHLMTACMDKYKTMFYVIHKATNELAGALCYEARPNKPIRLEHVAFYGDHNNPDVYREIIQSFLKECCVTPQCLPMVITEIDGADDYARDRVLLESNGFYPALLDEIVMLPFDTIKDLAVRLALPVAESILDQDT